MTGGENHPSDSRTLCVCVCVCVCVCRVHQGLSLDLEKLEV